MLLEIAMGDTYGAGFEFVKPVIIETRHDFKKYYPSWIDEIEAGQYTDDTQMSLAIVELILSKKEWTRENVTEYFLKTFKRDPRQTYAQGFFEFLKKTETVSEFLENIHNNSIKNGAAMRSVPLGVLKDKNDLLEKAKIQASITHNTPEGIVSSQAIALASHYFINKIGNKEDLFEYICRETGWKFSKEKTDRTQCDAIDTINAVLTVLSKSMSLKEVIDRSVKLGGDTDSVASIACGLASLSDEYSKDLPEFMERDLENGQYGRDYIKQLDNKLMNLVID